MHFVVLVPLGIAILLLVLKAITIIILAIFGFAIYGLFAAINHIFFSDDDEEPQKKKRR